MAKNDKLLLDGIIDDRVAARLPSDKRGEAFEFLAFEQVMKDYDLSTDEILTGSIDGRGVFSAMLFCSFSGYIKVGRHIEPWSAGSAAHFHA